jgi:sulfatase maturation enzyme AslB (radical SAM superfamily)
LEEVIITNDSLLTEDKIEKLVELSVFSPIGIRITIDGMKEVMNKRRPLAGGVSVLV